MVEAGLIGIGAGVAIAFTGFATGYAMSDVGSAAVGATAENEEMFGRGLVFMVIPETIVLFGFVIAFLLLGEM
jgi:V/A-type H+-transporting ATPase subunit K